MDEFFLIEALASCAIEGNALAIELLELKDTDPIAFWKRVSETWPVRGTEEKEYIH